MTPGLSAVTRMRIVRDSPGGMAPEWHTTCWPLTSQLPVWGLASIRVTSGGRVSDTTTSLATTWPWLVTVRV